MLNINMKIKTLIKADLDKNEDNDNNRHIKEVSEESEEFDDLDENIEHTDRYLGNYKNVGNDEENGHFIKFENLCEIEGDFR